MNLVYIGLGMGYAFAAAVQPGPFQAFLIHRTLQNGWKSTLPAAFAPLISDGPIILMVLVIIRNLPNAFLHMIRLIGGVFLLFLAYQAYRSLRNIGRPHDSGGASVRTFLQAVTVNILNPAPYLGWSLIMGPLLLEAWQQSTTTGLLFLSAFYTILISTTMALVILISFADHLAERINRLLMAFSALALLLFACYQWYQGLIGLLRV